MYSSIGLLYGTVASSAVPTAVPISAVSEIGVTVPDH
jgi:hypothetical protein